MHRKDTYRIRSAAGPRPRRGAAAPDPSGQPPRRQSRQRSRARLRRQRRRRTGLAVLALAAATTAAFLFVDPPWQDDGATVAGQREQARPTPPPAATVTASPKVSTSPKASVSPKASASKKAPDPPSVPESGPGTFTVARGDLSSGAGGNRYRVEVEDGLDVDPDGAAADIAAIFNHPRGWGHQGKETFRQVADNSAGLVIKIATPKTTDRICGKYGLDTGGEVNCRVGETVMVNLKRWELGSPMFDGPATEYRALIINHEVGHWLGRFHETCPGPGLPAPAMMQQIKGLKGCKSNAWPYDEQGEYLGGPSVP